ncbi:unnamed protein product, partial [Allacma fusca]
MTGSSFLNGFCRIERRQSVRAQILLNFIKVLAVRVRNSYCCADLVINTRSLRNEFQDFGQALYGEIHDCKEDGSYCMKNIECCSEYCTDLTCGPCKETGSWCLFDSDCCSGICTYLTCRGCKTEWVACLTDEECCSNR